MPRCDTRGATGAWRSLAARLLWEQEVAGSNPAAPTRGHARLWPMIAVTGATGGVGGRVARRARRRRLALRLVVRDGRARRTWSRGRRGAVPRRRRDAGGVRGRGDRLPRVGVRVRRPGRRALSAVDAAAAAGVERIVYVSFMGAAPDAVFTFARDHAATEERIRSTGLAHVFLRSCMYASTCRCRVRGGRDQGPAVTGAPRSSRATTSPTSRPRCSPRPRSTTGAPTTSPGPRR